ncbi:hypothetical protein Droror1_Dr00001027 [Drosera rotundifolia]
MCALEKEKVFWGVWKVDEGGLRFGFVGFRALVSIWGWSSIVSCVLLRSRPVTCARRKLRCYCSVFHCAKVWELCWNPGYRALNWRGTSWRYPAIGVLETEEQLCVEAKFENWDRGWCPVRCSRAKQSPCAILVVFIALTNSASKGLDFEEQGTPGGCLVWKGTWVGSVESLLSERGAKCEFLADVIKVWFEFLADVIKNLRQKGKLGESSSCENG